MITRCWREVSLQPGMPGLVLLLLGFLVAAAAGTGFLQAYPAATVSITGTSVAEGDSGTVDMVFTVTRTGDTGLGVIVGYRTVDGTATAGTDYAARTGTVTIPPGAASATIRVPVIGNTVLQADRAFIVELTGVIHTFGPPVALAPQQAFATGTGPNAVDVADFDGDGRPDLVTANIDSDTVSVLLNTAPPAAAGPSFGAQLTFAAGDGPRDVAVGDFNADGRPDITTVNSSSHNMSVLLNTTPPGGALNFAAAQNFVTWTNPFSLAVADFNSDHLPDLVVTSIDAIGKLSVFLNTTAPSAAAVSFAARMDWDTSTWPTAVTAADLNADGRPDLAVSEFTTGMVHVFLGTTAPGAAVPTFAPRADFFGGPSPWAISAGDLNGDHRLDLVVANLHASTVSVLINAALPQSAAPSFLPLQSFASGSWPEDVKVGDFNGDNQVDLAVADRTDHTVSVLVNTTAPWDTTAGFAARQVFGAGSCPTALAAGDFNGVGRLGLAVANNCGHNVSVLLNPAPLENMMAVLPVLDHSLYEMIMEPPSTFIIFATASIMAGDFNGDGRPDLLASIIATDYLAGTTTGMLEIFLNTTSAGDLKPSFAESQVVNLGSVAGHVAYEGGAAYCAAKAGELQITRALRLELCGTGVRVATVDPGMAETEFSLVRFKGDAKRAAAVYQGTQPLTAEDVAEAVLWVASRPPHVCIDEMLIKCTDQAAIHKVHRRPAQA